MKNQRDYYNRRTLEGKRVCTILTRVSKIEQANGLEVQEKTCMDYAVRNGIEVDGVIRCIGKGQESAQDIFSYVANHKQVNTILVYSNDRLTRLPEVLREIQAFLKVKGVAVISATDENVNRTAI